MMIQPGDFAGARQEYERFINSVPTGLQSVLNTAYDAMNPAQRLTFDLATDGGRMREPDDEFDEEDEQATRRWLVYEVMISQASYREDRDQAIRRVYNDLVCSERYQMVLSREQIRAIIGLFDMINYPAIRS